MGPTTVLDEKAIDRTITRISHEILEKNGGSKNLSLIGIRTRGIYLAKRIQEKINTIEKRELPVGVLDITMYRDDIFKLKTPRSRKLRSPSMSTT